MSLPLISVVIPSYNREKTIERSVRSVLRQTYKNIECIVVDDCSTDNTEAVIKSINDKRLKYVKLEKNSGACAARNRGIEEAKGEYIAFQDSDDEFLPEKLEKQLKCLLDTDSDMIYCSMNRIGYKTNGVFPCGESRQISILELLMGCGVSTQTMFVKASILKELRFDENMRSWKEDYELAVRIGEKYKVYFLSEPLVNVYLSEDSLTKSNMFAKDVYVSSYLLEKHIKLADQFTEWKVWLLNNIAYNKTMLGDKTAILYKDIYDMQPTKSNKIKYILSKIGLLKLFYKIKK